MRLASSSASLVVVDDGSLVTGQRVVVASSVIRETTPGTLLNEDGDEEPVSIEPHPAVPAGVVGVSRALASSLDLAAGEGEWVLVWGERPLGSVTSAALQPHVVMQPEQASRHLSKGLSEVADTILLVKRGESPTVRVAGQLFSVVEIRPQPPAGGALLRLDARTVLSVFSPTALVGIDAVILADRSGSMGMTDLKDPHGVAISRAEAVRRALTGFLDLRHTVHGRMSRFALVSFADTCEVLFPARGGMAPLDADQPNTTFQEFQRALTRLRTGTDTTDIGRALHYASDLLARHGHPGNERLIVLLSDGTENAEADDEDIGRVVDATMDTVSLMADLHRRTGVRLQALGVSDATLAQAWWAAKKGGKPDPWAIPDHRLLRDLVTVGGGDLERCGDASVLAEYFNRLSGGTARTLPALRPKAPPRMSDVERARLTQTSPPTPVDRQRETLCQRIGALWVGLNELSTGCVAQRAIFANSPRVYETLLRGLWRRASGLPDFAWWLLGVHQAFFEARDERVAKNTPGAYPVQGVVELLFDDRFWDINLFRNQYAHDKTRRGEKARDERERQRWLEKVEAAMVRRIGRVLRAEHDPGWDQLQASLLADLAETLVQLDAVFRRAPPAATSAAPTCLE